jgi:preprotein translocase subunit YajC
MTMFVTPAFAEAMEARSATAYCLAARGDDPYHRPDVFPDPAAPAEEDEGAPGLVKNLRRGDTVVTSGGLVGKVTKVVDEEQIEVEIADGVRVRQVRSMISGVRAKGEPVKDDGSKAKGLKGFHRRPQRGTNRDGLRS